MQGISLAHAIALLHFTGPICGAIRTVRRKLHPMSSSRTMPSVHKGKAIFAELRLQWSVLQGQANTQPMAEKICQWALHAQLLEGTTNTRPFAQWSRPCSNHSWVTIASMPWGKVNRTCAWDRGRNCGGAMSCPISSSSLFSPIVANAGT